MRLLVIEDEVNVARAVQRGLEADGFDVDIAHDGDTGLWMAREHDYALIVLDIMLPGTNGYVVCATLREEADTTPILMLTAKHGEHDQAEGLDTGADDYLTKPFSMVVLRAHVRALLRRGGTPPTADILSVGDVDIDRVGRVVRVSGNEVGLTNREFALLDTLAYNHTGACSKSYLVNQVWGPSFDGVSNVVEVYVGYVRRKLAAANATARIETVRGHGYRLVA